MSDIDRNYLVSNAALDKLPLFATDLEIAIAVVGKQHASHWKRFVLPILEARHGFPRYDKLHEGRPVPLVKRFYDTYLGVSSNYLSHGADEGEENLEAWIDKRVKKRIDDEERRRAAGQDVVERDPGDHHPEILKAMAEYRAKRAAEYAAKKR